MHDGNPPFDCGAICDGLREVIQNEPGKNLLTDESGLFTMKMEQTHRVFGFTERGFDAAAHFINGHKVFERTPCNIVVYDMHFHFAIGEFEPDKAKRKRVERFVAYVQRVITDGGGDVAILIAVVQQISNLF